MSPPPHPASPASSPSSQTERHPMAAAKSREFLACLGEFFCRDLIALPLARKHLHAQVQTRCNIRAASLELDTSAYPNIEYIAGNRLSVYPANPLDHVQAIMRHLEDDISPPGAASSPSATSSTAAARKRAKMSAPWSRFVALHGKDSLKLALVHLYDIMTAPSRDLLRIIAERCTSKEQKARLLNICKTDESWEKWICANLRTLKSTLDEFNSCQALSAKALISELTLQQPRQYSISSIKSSKRFRTELVVFQHKFSLKHVAAVVASLKNREDSLRRPPLGQNENTNITRPGSPLPSGAYGPMKSSPISLHVNHDGKQQQQQQATDGNSFSIRSLRSVNAFGTSPISTQQVKRVPAYSGPLMSLYASSALNVASDATSSTSDLQQQQQSAGSGKSIAGGQTTADGAQATKKLPSEQILPMQNSSNSKSSSGGAQFEGLCSSYLLNLALGDSVVCEFVENPRFTLKGNRERPIMMIGQDVGVVAFRPFWQQRALEHDRAQIFYTLFKDLSPKKFGDMQLVCLTGNRCKLEDLFRGEIKLAITNKIISSVTYINRSALVALLDQAALSSQGSGVAAAAAASRSSAGAALKQLPIESKELLELGARIAKLLVENNGCIYTCCDAPMTQAIEIFIVEALARNTSLSRSRIMSLLPKWKGRRVDEQPATAATNNRSGNKFLYTLENPFERAQIVQEIYESSI